MHVSKPDAFLLRIIAAAFPSYKGRTLQVCEWAYPMDVRSSWEGGSRSSYVFLKLDTFERLSVPSQSAFDRKIAGADGVPPVEGTVCVEHVIFRGKDLGIRIHAPAVNMVKLLPAGPVAELTRAEKIVVAVTCGLKSFARVEYAERLGVDAAAYAAAKAALIARGILSKQGAATPEARNLQESLKLPGVHSELAWSKVA